jgi:hypothetical protein
LEPILLNGLVAENSQRKLLSATSCPVEKLLVQAGDTGRKGDEKQLQPTLPLAPRSLILDREGENLLPITSKVPMTPIERCIVNGDQDEAEACRAALQQVPAPETPDVSLIFNPEGLSNYKLEKLAELGTANALEKLQ